MTGDEASRLRSEVRRAYSEAAARPRDQHPFPVGRRFAESLGYTAAVLNGLPSTALEAFTGVSNVALFADLSPGDTVLDVGCGAGLDSLIAAGRVGTRGRVIGIDFSETMLSRARQGASEAVVGNVCFCRADAHDLPLADESVDVALVNGVVNLNPERERLLAELARALRPGGTVYAAELILKEPLRSAETVRDADWFA